MLGGLGVDGAVDGLEVAGDGLAVLVGDVAHRASDLVDDAGLHPRLREDGLDRLGEPGQPVDAGHEDVGDAAVLQIVEDGQPELGALGLLPPDPEHLALALDADADRQVARARAHRAVLADLDHQRVEVDDRVDGLQRSGAPSLDVGQDGVGDPADRVALDLNAVEVGEVCLDIAHAHAAGVEAEDLVVEPGQAGLALGHQLWLEAALAIARRLDRDAPELGAHGLLGRAVAMVGRAARRRLPGLVAKVLGQLGAQRGLDHPARQLREQAARAGNLLGLKAVQCVLQLLGGQQSGQPVSELLGRPGRTVAGALGGLGLRVLCSHRGPFRPRRRVAPAARPSRGSRPARPDASGRVGHPDLTQNIGQTPLDESGHPPGS